MKLISVIIPAYNVAGYIGTTLKSLLSQISDDVEIIVVDDGSEDNTADFVESAIAGSGTTGHKLIRQPNRGVSAARNAGLYAAVGTYVYFLDGDDYVSDVLIQTLRPMLAKKAVDICCWKFDLVNPDMTVYRTYKQNLRKEMMQPGETSGISALENILVHHSLYIWTGSAAYRRTFLINNKMNFHVGCQRGEDVEFIQKALLRADRVRFVDSTLSYYMQRQGSAIHNFSVRRFDAVCATVRTSMNLDPVVLQSHSRLGYILRYRRPVEDFLFVAAFSMIHSGIRSTALNQMIDSEYPQLRCQIDKTAVEDLKMFDRFRWLYRVYRCIPRLFLLCVRTFSRYQGA
jgi:glycosyltransferase involved in cell wall biosynthesis